MADDLAGAGRMRVDTVAGDGGPEAGRRRVQFPEQVRHAAQGEIGPGIPGEPVPVPGLPLRVHRDVPVDEGEHLPVVLGAKHPGRALEPGCLQMAQILVHGRRPRTHRTQQPVAAAHHPAGHAPPRKRHVLPLPRLISHQIAPPLPPLPPLPAPATRPSQKSKKVVEYSAYLDSLVPYRVPNYPREPDLPRETGGPARTTPRPDQARHTPPSPPPAATAPPARPRRTRLRGPTSEPLQHQRTIVVAASFHCRRRPAGAKRRVRTWPEGLERQ